MFGIESNPVAKRDSKGHGMPKNAATWMDEKRDLLRAAAQSALNRSRGGKDLPADARRWAEHWANQPALTHPMSQGDEK